MASRLFPIFFNMNMLERGEMNSTMYSSTCTKSCPTKSILSLTQDFSTTVLRGPIHKWYTSGQSFRSSSPADNVLLCKGHKTLQHGGQTYKDIYSSLSCTKSKVSPALHLHQLNKSESYLVFNLGSITSNANLNRKISNKVVKANENFGTLHKCVWATKFPWKT